MAEQKRIVKSPAKAIALALGGVVGLLAVGAVAPASLGHVKALYR